MNCTRENFRTEIQNGLKYQAILYNHNLNRFFHFHGKSLIFSAYKSHFDLSCKPYRSTSHNAPFNIWSVYLSSPFFHTMPSLHCLNNNDLHNVNNIHQMIHVHWVPIWSDSKLVNTLNIKLQFSAVLSKLLALERTPP